MKLLLVTLVCVGAVVYGANPKGIPMKHPELETTDHLEAKSGGFEGDMKLDKAGGASDRNMIDGDDRRWPKVGQDVIVPYTFASGVSAAKKKQVEASAEDYAKFTCVKFVPRSNQKDYIEIYSGTGCHSNVGKVGGKQELSLEDGCETQKGTVTHEMMHAIGFFHEQSRADRDQFITVVKNNIESGKEDQFDICDENSRPSCTRPDSGYDYNSVMHYGETAFSKDKTSKTMIPKKSGAVLGQRGGLNPNDVKKIGQMYKCGSHTVKPRNGAKFPSEELYNKAGNCDTIKLSSCANPQGDYQFLRLCAKTCDGAKQGSNYDVYSNCPDLAKGNGCSQDPSMKTDCAYSCNGNKF